MENLNRIFEDVIKENGTSGSRVTVYITRLDPLIDIFERCSANQTGQCKIDQDILKTVAREYKNLKSELNDILEVVY